MDLRERTQHSHRHPWETVRAAYFQRLVRRFAANAATVVDVGAGDSWFASELLRTSLPSATTVCWDISYTDSDLADWQHPAITRTVTAPQLKADLVVALDVIEHVSDDHDFVVHSLLPLLHQSGVLIASVPAHQRLFTRHDTALGHHRRYSQQQLHSLLEPHFHIVAEGSLFTTLLAPRFASVVIERLRPSPATITPESEWKRGGLVTALVSTALRADTAVVGVLRRCGIRLPGLSVWAVCVPRNLH